MPFSGRWTLLLLLLHCAVCLLLGTLPPVLPLLLSCAIRCPFVFPVWPLSDSSLPPFPFICCTMQPTNHLDLEACVWLEDYLANFKRILLMVSHRHACARTGTGGFAACAALC